MSCEVLLLSQLCQYHSIKGLFFVILGIFFEKILGDTLANKLELHTIMIANFSEKGEKTLKKNHLKLSTKSSKS